VHSLVFVIIPTTTSDISGEVARLLDGSKRLPERIYSQYQVVCSCSGSFARIESFNRFDATLEGRELLAALKLAREQKNQTAEEDTLRRRFKAIRVLERQHPYYLRPDPDCDLCGGTGTYLESRDPAGNWDNWEIGGRWAGLFPANALNCAVVDDALQTNLALVSEVRLTTQPAVIVTPEGEWYSGPIVFNGALFGDDRNEHEMQERRIWQQEVERLLLSYRDHLAVVVDCHS
jgi:hypothetical protein